MIARMYPPKDPDAVLDYSFDWNPWLAADEVIVASSFVVPDGLTEPNPSTFADRLTTLWLAGGTAGTEYAITNRITTSAGRVDERTAALQVKEK